MNQDTDLQAEIKKMRAQAHEMYSDAHESRREMEAYKRLLTDPDVDVDIDPEEINELESEIQELEQSLLQNMERLDEIEVLLGE